VSAWPKRYQLAHAFLWKHSDKRLKLAQLLGQRLAQKSQTLGLVGLLVVYACSAVALLEQDARVQSSLMIAGRQYSHSP
jgi:hypothetical protein